MNGIVQDFRYAVRMLRKSPGFTAIAILTLALGIGANTAVFTVVNSTLLRPLPYRDSERLASLRTTLPDFPEFHLEDSSADVGDIRAQNHVFEGTAIFRRWQMNLSGDGEPQVEHVVLAAPDFFALVGAAPARGRIFSNEELEPGKDGVAILSDALWRDRYGADPKVIGRTIRLDTKPYIVIGVMPANFQFSETKLYVPLALTPKERDDREMHEYSVLVKMKRGVSLKQAQAEMDSFAANFRKQYPNDDRGIKFILTSLQEDTIGNSRLALLVLMAAVVLVLLIGCANVGSLALARSLARQKEVAVRSALGASRGRIVRQFLVESLLLAIIGGAVGWLLGMYGVDAFRHLAPPNTPRLEDLRMDRWVFAFTMGVSVLASVLFGLAPALQSSRTSVGGALKESGPFGLTGTRGRQRTRSALVTLEVSLALILLASSALLIKSFVRLTHVEPGFRADHLLTARISLPDAKYSTPESQMAFLNELMERLSSLPAEHIAAGNAPVLGGQMMLTIMEVEGAAKDTSGTNSSFETQYVTPGYFATLQIPFVRGRDFSSEDMPKSPGVVIANESFARRFWPNADAIGKRVSFNKDPKGNPEWLEVVGIVKDIRDVSPSATARPEIYSPAAQSAMSGVSIFIRTQSDPHALLPALRDVVRSIDADLPLTEAGTMDESIHKFSTTPRFQSILLSVFAGLGLSLALIGIYGVIAISVTQQTREIGIRMALGAQPGDVMRMMLRRGLLWIGAGTAAGLLGAFAATRLLGSLLFEVKATDPVSFAIATGMLVAAALAACYVPARRAMRVDPMVALRYE
jgi:putative ABC transport system permease protein